MRGKKVSSSIPTLTENNIMYETDQAKANLFANKLKEIFTDADDTRFDEKFKKEVCNYLEKNNLNEDAHQDKDYFSTSEFNKVVKGLKKHCSPGKDEIHNLLLINASSEFKKILLQLCNLTTKNGSLPTAWKSSIVTMIPKKVTNSKNPKDYRPISLTSCLSKVCEKLIKNQFNDFLKRNNLIIKQLSGFRAHRQTRDNIFHLSQKIMESFNRKKKVCTIFFDIASAFDKVWQD